MFCGFYNYRHLIQSYVVNLKAESLIQIRHQTSWWVFAKHLQQLCFPSPNVSSIESIVVAREMVSEGWYEGRNQPSLQNFVSKHPLFCYDVNSYGLSWRKRLLWSMFHRRGGKQYLLRNCIGLWAHQICQQTVRLSRMLPYCPSAEPRRCHGNIELTRQIPTIWTIDWVEIRIEFWNSPFSSPSLGGPNALKTNSHVEGTYWYWDVGRYMNLIW